MDSLYTILYLVEHELAQLRREESIEVEHHRHEGVPQPEGAVRIRADLAVEGVEPHALVQRAVPLAVREVDLAPPSAAEVRAEYLRGVGARQANIPTRVGWRGGGRVGVRGPGRGLGWGAGLGRRRSTGPSSAGRVARRRVRG